MDLGLYIRKLMFQEDDRFHGESSLLGVPSSRMLSRVAFVISDVSEELIASITQGALLASYGLSP
jgi:hypothetical protein